MAKMSLKFDKSLFGYAFIVAVLVLLMNWLGASLLNMKLLAFGLLGLTIGGYLVIVLAIYVGALIKDKITK